MWDECVWDKRVFECVWDESVCVCGMSVECVCECECGCVSVYGKACRQQVTVIRAQTQGKGGLPRAILDPCPGSGLCGGRDCFSHPDLSLAGRKGTVSVSS